MDEKIITFYEERHQPISMLINKRRTDRLTPDSIEAGAEDLYDRIQDGLDISPQKIPREVWRLSHRYVGKKYKEGTRKRDHIKLLKRLGHVETMYNCLIWVVSIYAVIKIGEVFIK